MSLQPPTSNPKTPNPQPSFLAQLLEALEKDMRAMKKCDTRLTAACTHVVQLRVYTRLTAACGGNRIFPLLFCCIQIISPLHFCNI